MAASSDEKKLDIRAFSEISQPSLTSRRLRPSYKIAEAPELNRHSAWI
jgi:hypothetical protein